MMKQSRAQYVKCACEVVVVRRNSALGFVGAEGSLQVVHLAIQVSPVRIERDSGLTSSALAAAILDASKAGVLGPTYEHLSHLGSCGMLL
eukprot:1513737-Amphidinium_carterae.1